MVRLAGSWSLERGLPSLAELETAFDAGVASRITFDTRELAG
jgi:hypothetical protein